jgi:hypothetical protein
MWCLYYRPTYELPSKEYQVCKHLWGLVVGRITGRGRIKAITEWVSLWCNFVSCFPKGCVIACSVLLRVGQSITCHHTNFIHQFLVIFTCTFQETEFAGSCSECSGLKILSWDRLTCRRFIMVLLSTHKSCYHSVLYGPSYWQRPLLNHKSHLMQTLQAIPLSIYIGLVNQRLRKENKCVSAHQNVESNKSTLLRSGTLFHKHFSFPKYEEWRAIINVLICVCKNQHRRPEKNNRYVKKFLFKLDCSEIRWGLFV